MRIAIALFDGRRGARLGRPVGGARDLGAALARRWRRGLHGRRDRRSDPLRQRPARARRPHLGAARARSTCSSTRAASGRARSSGEEQDPRADARARRRGHADDERLHRLARVRRRRAARRPAGDDALAARSSCSRSLGERIDVRPDARFVDDGEIITAAGVSAGIDMALHLVARLHSPERAAAGATRDPVRPRAAGLAVERR